MHAVKITNQAVLAQRPQRLIAMRDERKTAGSMLGPPIPIVANAEASSSLGSVQDFRPYQAAGYFTQACVGAGTSRRAWKNISRRSSRRTLADGASTSNW